MLTSLLQPRVAEDRFIQKLSVNELAGSASCKLFTEHYVQRICWTLGVGAGGSHGLLMHKPIFLEDLGFSSAIQRRRGKNSKAELEDLQQFSCLPSLLSPSLFSPSHATLVFFEKGSHVSQVALKLVTSRVCPWTFDLPISTLWALGL